MPETMRHGAHRALRQVLAAAVQWQWIERNVAARRHEPDASEALAAVQRFEARDHLRADRDTPA